MQKPKIQRVRSVPPMPTTTIVNPNVQLSILRYLLVTFGGRTLLRTTSLSTDERLKELGSDYRRGSPERRRPL